MAPNQEIEDCKKKDISRDNQSKRNNATLMRPSRAKDSTISILSTVTTKTVGKKHMTPKLKQEKDQDDSADTDAGSVMMANRQGKKGGK